MDPISSRSSTRAFCIQSIQSAFLYLAASPRAASATTARYRHCAYGPCGSHALSAAARMSSNISLSPLASASTEDNSCVASCDASARGRLLEPGAPAATSAQERARATGAGPGLEARTTGCGSTTSSGALGSFSSKRFCGSASACRAATAASQPASQSTRNPTTAAQ